MRRSLAFEALVSDKLEARVGLCFHLLDYKMQPCIPMATRTIAGNLNEQPLPAGCITLGSNRYAVHAMPAVYNLYMSPAATARNVILRFKCDTAARGEGQFSTALPDQIAHI